MFEPTKKAFKITSGRGFQVTYPNGYTVSVQFGVFNYCDNKSYEIGETVSINGMHFMEADLKAGQNGSDTAETAILNPAGGFVPYDKNNPEGFVQTDDDYCGAFDVQGHMTPFDVLTLMVRVAALPPASQHQIAEAEGEIV